MTTSKSQLSSIFGFGIPYQLVRIFDPFFGPRISGFRDFVKRLAEGVKLPSIPRKSGSRTGKPRKPGSGTPKYPKNGSGTPKTGVRPPQNRVFTRGDPLKTRENPKKCHFRPFSTPFSTPPPDPPKVPFPGSRTPIFGFSGVLSGTRKSR